MITPGPRWPLTGRMFALLAFAFSALVVACDSTSKITGLRPAERSATVVALSSTAGVVISQVYGGGGNSGATYKNDFIELYNGGPSDVSLAGASVQYTSATGSTWQVTPLSGVIAAGQYYLVKEAVGAGGTVDLPAPEATGTIAMSGTAGKVALVTGTTALTGICPLASAIDFVGYGNGTGTGLANCFEGTGPVPTLSNTTAALRKGNGSIDTNNNVDDFATGAPTPRNGGVSTLTATISPLTPSLAPGGTQTFTATATKGGVFVPVTSAAWTSSDPAVATIDPSSGAAVAAAAGTTTIGVTVTTDQGTAATSTVLTVTAPVTPANLIISQVYGGGGNAGATLRNDYIELYNAGTAAVNLAGWSVQYSSATGTGWTATNLSGDIQPGRYFLIQEAAGTGGSANLPAPDFIAGTTTGTTALAMAAGSGKVALVHATTPLAGSCPKTSPTVDFVGYGTADCFEGTAATPALSNTTAALRKGVTDTNDNAADFTVSGPAPRNSAFVPPPVSVSPSTWSLTIGQTKALTATEVDPSNRPVPTTFAWSSADASVATVDPSTGVVTGRGEGQVVITATATDGKTGTATITVASSVTLSSGKTSFALGMQTQFFVGGTDASGAAVKSATWSTSDASVITVDQHGVVTGKGLGAARLFATAADGTRGSVAITVYLAAGATVPLRLGHNVEFGEPADADPSDDFLIRRAQYTVSYNPRRGGANWVSWNVDKSHIGDSGRCVGTCYSADTVLTKAGLPAYTTADWVSNLPGVTGYDRGHMAPSADWTSSEADNNTTFFLTNFLPQRADLNQGPWEVLESAIRDSVKAGREAYVIAGGIFTNGVGLGTLLDSGKVGIPDSTYKIVIFTPDGTGINPDGTLPVGSTVLAVNMPNAIGIHDVPWETYKTTIAKIEKSTGYDYLALLADAVECQVEQRPCAPVAQLTGSGLAGGAEGQTLTFDASTSTDQGGAAALHYEWSVDGQAVGTGATLSYTFRDNGVYQVRVVATNAGGVSDAASAAVTITNVAPSVASFTGATIAEGSTYSTSGSFADPGDDHWSATVDYGDGTGAQPLTLAGTSFALSHTYANNGQYTVTVTVTETDAEAASGSRTATVTVTNVAPAVGAFAGATILRGESYTSSGTFTDPGADTWTATVNYGDGSAPSAATLSGRAFTLQHTYATAGVYTVTVTVADADGSGSRSAAVTVLSTGAGITSFASTIAGLASTGAVQDDDAKWLANKLDIAGKELARDNLDAVRNQLGYVIGRIEAARLAGRLSADTAASLTAYANRLLASMS